MGSCGRRVEGGTVLACQAFQACQACQDSLGSVYQALLTSSKPDCTGSKQALTSRGSPLGYSGRSVSKLTSTVGDGSDSNGPGGWQIHPLSTQLN